jgi:hypothetical protein
MTIAVMPAQRAAESLLVSNSRFGREAAVRTESRVERQPLRRPFARRKIPTRIIPTTRRRMTVPTLDVTARNTLSPVAAENTARAMAATATGIVHLDSKRRSFSISRPYPPLEN